MDSLFRSFAKAVFDERRSRFDDVDDDGERLSRRTHTGHDDLGRNVNSRVCLTLLLKQRFGLHGIDQVFHIFIVFTQHQIGEIGDCVTLEQRDRSFQ